jgi:lipid A 4'-phosphatase
VIKKIQIELTVFILLVISVLLTNNIDSEIYKFFSKLNYGKGTPQLKKFFVNITELGDSLWYFLILIFVFLFSFLFKKIDVISNKSYFYLRNFSVFSFIYLVSTGVMTQIIKHLVGRVRPNNIGFEEITYFNFFTTNSSFHSLPSGHTSTIIAVTIVLCLALPSLRFFLFISGSIIAVSRVVVGAHFFTDVVAGALIAIIVYKILIYFYEVFFPKINLNNFKIQKVSALIKAQIIFVVIAIFVTIGSDLDVYLSGVFYYYNERFLLQSFDMVSLMFRKFLLPSLIVYIFVLPTLSKLPLIQKFFFNYIFSFKEIMFIWITGLTTLILFINILLKDMWGRARPNDILNFGGEETFTPWYKFSDSCTSNCSFVSGDASVGFILIIFYFIIKKNIYCYLALFFGITLGFIRIIAGGHFLSDIIFSQIVVTASVSVFYIFNTKLNAK